MPTSGDRANVERAVGQTKGGAEGDSPSAETSTDSYGDGNAARGNPHPEQ